MPRRFRAAHEADWERLDKIVTAIEKRGGPRRCPTTTAGAAAALPLDAVLAVGRARDLARPRADRLSRAALHPRLFPDLRRADLAAAPARPFLRAQLARGGAGAVARNAGRVPADRRRRGRRAICWCATTRAGSTCSSPTAWPAGRDPTASARDAARARSTTAAATPSRARWPVRVLPVHAQCADRDLRRSRWASPSPADRPADPL